MSFEELRRNFYNRVPATPSEPKALTLLYSDIVSHLPVIEYYASLSESCVEFGVRQGQSTTALLAGCPGDVFSWDLNDSPAAKTILEDPATAHRWHFHRQSSIDPTLVIPETDLIFFDTLHTYNHLSAELAQHAHRSRKFLIFHDTFTCGQRDASGPDPLARGILPAIEEYVAWHPEWVTVYETTRCNGLLVLKNVSV